jgi:hypothetical protein
VQVPPYHGTLLPALGLTIGYSYSGLLIVLQAEDAVEGEQDHERRFHSTLLRIPGAYDVARLQERNILIIARDTSLWEHPLTLSGSTRRFMEWEWSIMTFGRRFDAKTSRDRDLHN